MAKPRTRAAGPDSATPPQYPIESVDNALKLLLLFSEQAVVRLTDASGYLGVAASTAHRLLAMLQYRGFVRQDPATKAYAPGPALTVIAASINRRSDVRARARPVLEKLNVDLNETITLGRLEGRAVNFVDSVESNQTVRVVSRAGQVMPANCTSTGKAMLSELSAAELHRLFPDERLDTMTKNSIATRTELEVDLDRIRRRGYATSAEENEEGVASVAVPVPAHGDARYAINVSVPVSRMTAAAKTRFATALQSGAAELGALLG
jgi:IclR family transcriptional regulator, acetate operon repressor